VVTNPIVVAGRTNVLLTTNAVSLTGIAWETTATGLTTNTLQGIGWNGSLYVVVGGNGTVLRSPDGTNWIRGAVPAASFLSGVTAIPGGWVASGTAGAIFTSPDAVAWTPRTSGTSNWVYRVRAFGDSVIAVGQNGLILTSPDGIAWTPRSSGTTAWLTDLTQVGGALYVCGTQGTVLRSTNLVDWATIPTLTGKALYGMASDGGQVVTGGAEAVILRAVAEPDARPVAISAYGLFPEPTPPMEGFVFQGVSEQRFRLEGTSALGEWTSEAELELGVEGTAVHGRIGSDPARFHRTVTRP
jgi:hypothetical protein